MLLVLKCVGRALKLTLPKTGSPSDGTLLFSYRSVWLTACLSCACWYCRNVQSAIDYAKGTISDLLQNKMDISMLVITKQLGGC